MLNDAHYFLPQKLARLKRELARVQQKYLDNPPADHDLRTAAEDNIEMLRVDIGDIQTYLARHGDTLNTI